MPHHMVIIQTCTCCNLLNSQASSDGISAEQMRALPFVCVPTN